MFFEIKDEMLRPTQLFESKPLTPFALVARGRMRVAYAARLKPRTSKRVAVAVMSNEGRLRGPIETSSFATSRMPSPSRMRVAYAARLKPSWLNPSLSSRAVE